MSKKLNIRIITIIQVIAFLAQDVAFTAPAMRSLGTEPRSTLAAQSIFKSSPRAILEHELAVLAISGALLSADTDVEISRATENGNIYIHIFLSRKVVDGSKVTVECSYRLDSGAGRGFTAVVDMGKIGEDGFIVLKETAHRRYEMAAQFPWPGAEEFETRAMEELKTDPQRIAMLNQEARANFMMVLPAISSETIETDESGTRKLKCAIENEEVARKFLKDACEALGLRPYEVGHVVYELSYNVIKHGGGGILILRKIRDGKKIIGIEMIARDLGDGIEDVEAVREWSKSAKAQVRGRGHGFSELTASTFADRGSLIVETNHAGGNKIWIFDKASGRFVLSGGRGRTTRGTRVSLTLPAQDNPRTAQGELNPTSDESVAKDIGGRIVSLTLSGKKVVLAFDTGISEGARSVFKELKNCENFRKWRKLARALSENIVMIEAPAEELPANSAEGGIDPEDATNRSI